MAAWAEMSQSQVRAWWCLAIIIYVCFVFDLNLFVYFLTNGQ